MDHRVNVNRCKHIKPCFPFSSLQPFNWFLVSTNSIPKLLASIQGSDPCSCHGHSRQPICSKSVDKVIFDEKRVVRGKWRGCVLRKESETCC